MRITGGTHRGRILKAPEGRAVRPTSDMMRQVVFNMMLKYGMPQDAIVVDVFCGTGALGLEALSRGAVFCSFIEKQKEHLDCAKTNASSIGLAKQCSFLQKDALKLGRSDKAATLALLDPPYRQDLTAPALAALAEGGWLAPGALCVLETETGASDALPDGFVLLDQRRHGDTQARFVRYGPASGKHSPARS